MANKNVKLKNRNGDYLYPYTDNIPTGTSAVAGKVKVDTTPTSGSGNAITSGAVYTALAGKLATTGTAAKATADADGNNIASTYLKKSEEGTGGLNMLASQLRKAHAWTWSHTITTGTAFVFQGTTLFDGISCSSYSHEGGYGTYFSINGNLYYLNIYATPYTVTQQTSDGDITEVGYGNCIKGGKLYSFFKKAYTDNNTGWTKISGFFGLKKGALYTFTNQSTLICSCIDSAGVWTDLSYGYNDGDYCAGIRDGLPYYAARGTSSGGVFPIRELIQISDENGWEGVSVYSSSYFFFYKGTTYKCFQVNRIRTNNQTPYYQGSVDSQITKIYNNYVLTATHNVYQIDRNTPTLIASNVIDICSSGYLLSDGLYSYQKVKQIDGTFTACESKFLIAGAGTVQSKTVYTVANPAVNYKTYEQLNLGAPDTITATTATTITNSSKTYTRDISKDSTFIQSPDDLKKQSPTRWELIEMVQNLQ